MPRRYKNLKTIFIIHTRYVPFSYLMKKIKNIMKWTRNSRRWKLQMKNSTMKVHTYFSIPTSYVYETSNVMKIELLIENSTFYCMLIQT